MMRKITALALVVAVLGPVTVSAWGGLFNRLNPSMLSNFGYGGYGKSLYGVSDKALKENPKTIEEEMERRMIQEEDEEDPCFEKRCTANEHCCDGYVCVDTEDDATDVSFGTCLPIFGKKQGEGCLRDNDCESGFLCLRDEGGEKSCQTPVTGTQTLGEDCRTSSDCNVEKGLCCKLQRRARSQPKKICTYFTDPQMCIGPVASPRLRPVIEHTAGEKRHSSHPDYPHLRK